MAELDSTRTPIIRIGTTEAVKSVKDLRDNIKDLRDEIVALSNSEQKDAATSKQLAQAEQNLIKSQQELNRVMGLTKSGADGVEGSYNNLKAQLRETKQEMDAIPKLVNGELNPAWDALAQRYKELNEQAKAYDYELGNFQRNVGNYGNAWQSLGQSMGNVKQVGGDMVNGLSALSGVMNIFGANTKQVNLVMTGLRTTIGLLTGAKGLVGFLTGLKNTTKAQTAQTAATKAGTAASITNTTATAAGTAAHGASTIAKTAETTATWSLKTAVDALKAALSGGLSVVISIITTALSGLITWLTGAKDATDEFAEGAESAADKAAKAIDKIDEKLSEGSRKRKLEIKVMEAEGKTEEAIHNRQQEIYDEEIADRQRQIEENEKFLNDVEEWNKDYDKARKKEKKYFEQRKQEQDEQAKATSAQTKALKEEIKELRIAKDEEQQLYDAKLRNPNGKKGGSTNTDAAAKEAEKALKEIQDIFDSSLQGVDKINAKYDEAFKKLEENIRKVRVSEEVANEARAILEKQKTKELQEEYAKQYRDKYNGYKQSIDLLRKEADETENVYKGLIPTLKDSYEERIKLYDKQSNDTKVRLQQDIDAAKRLLGESITNEQWGLYLHFMEKSNDELKNLYRAMLADEKGFTEAWGAQFAEALKSIGPAIINSESQTKKDLTQFVNELKQEYENAVNNMDLTAIKKLRDKLIGNPPVAEDAELLAAAQDFVRRMDKKFYEAVMASENPLEVYMRGTTWHEVFDNLYTQPLNAAKEAVAQLKTELADMEMFTEEYFQKQVEIDMAEKKLHTARMKRWEAWNRQAGKYLSTYGAATSNMLSSVADAWEESLRSQENVNESAFNGVKALQYSTAVINTAAAVVQALADPTTPSYYVKIANAAAAVAAGTAQVIKIANTKYGTDGGAGNTAPKLTDRTPQLQYTYGINTADYATAMAQNPVRAYIVDKDLAEGMNNYEERLNETSF